MSEHPAQLPTLETQRLRLRPLTMRDVPAITRIAGRREIADTTITVPHPYTEDHAREFIARQTDGLRTGTFFAFGLEVKAGGDLIGVAVLREIDRVHEQAELGFWIGVDYWRHGYATEAAKALVSFAFETLGLNRVHAHHMVRNPASGGVLEKAGLQREGLLRQRVKKWGRFEDVVILAVLREEWLAKRR